MALGMSGFTGYAQETSLVGVTWHCWHGPGNSAMELVFYSNGEFIYMVRWTSNTYTVNGMQMGGITEWRERHKGTYSASNDTLILTYTSSERCDEPKMNVRHYDFTDTRQNWKAIAPLDPQSFQYRIRRENRTYLDINGLFPHLIGIDVRGGMKFTIPNEKAS